ncbi:protein translocase subunit SecDF [Schaedlerella arabinosiphila]|uniref:Multifunctional fusion protein n=1 Tax=Schaedlerella arabinosiphila TaxID=2044587 RepID=A0A9X5CAY8_9FIRM|nr:protein translocase subunit SecDF [Schaedlerella arabinosiphila]KAI4444492.1 Protein translocase subunit SecDF [Schaedlerella arabinosiphila]NDO70933.1 protein translocase subunit SecDF [Schaedlerella arabinosiphila]
MKKSKGIISLILIAVLIGLLGFTTAVGFGEGGSGAARNIKLGLDLEGGVSITYQVKGGTPSAEDMADTIYKLQRRVEQYSTEATVYQEGEDRISIEIPGVTNANEILDELGQPGSLYFISETDSEGEENYTYKDGKYVLNKTIEELQKEEGSIVLTGTDVKSASAQVQTNELTNANQNVVTLEMNPEGTEKFAEATKRAFKAEESIGIYYDGEFISVPNVNAEIKSGQAVIEGSMSFEEAERIASSIRIGGLSLELEELRSNVVGAQLGEEAISTSLKAGAIGLGIVFVFMCIAYLLPGFASSLALLIYTGLILVLLNAFDITLTLPGIAGIILGIGMAVDANVIIFARVREELAEGKSVKTSLNAGFQKALSAILDGNITTLIAAFVLQWLGSGTVKGFAQTLAMGIVVSMFTALVITRIIIYSFYAVGIRDKKFYGHAKKAEQTTVNFLGKRRLFFGISVLLIVVGFVFMGVNGAQGKGVMNYSLEFKGGTSTSVTFDKEYTLEEIDQKIVPVIEDVTGDNNVQVQKVEGTSQVIFKTQTLDLDKREAFNTAMSSQFQADEDKIATENISATVSSEMRQDAIVAVIVATICMLLYIWFRFKDIRFATSAVIALLHDVLVVLAFYVVARVSVGNTFIACMLTIVGYSINATIVIFDRIREELRTKKKNEGMDQLVNRCITRTLTRSIYTSLTTFVMVLVLFIMGVSSIKEFALPLMVGIICGAYSSVCITGALWYIMKNHEGRKAETAK